ncbi:MAG TPA: hypothetical protein VN667_08315 [Burkholderiales bacterium]|nr:hypothetical protein [Burkholderiales bacterium]
MATTRRPGRPKTSELTRAEQLRQAKRAQRERDRRAGQVPVQIKLGRDTAESLRRALAVAGFEEGLKRYLDNTVIDSARYPNLKLLCWNRAGRYLSGKDAFALYERNWRFVDQRRMDKGERELIARLSQEYGNGVLNV